MQNNFSLGEHLICDFVIDPSISSILNEIDRIYNFIEEATLVNNMTLITPPLVWRFPCLTCDYYKLADKYIELKDVFEKRKNDYGVSGIGVWLESHLSIHTFKEHNCVSIDAYTCGKLEINKTLNIIHKYFEKIIKINCVKLKRNLFSDIEVEKIL